VVQFGVLLRHGHGGLGAHVDMSGSWVAGARPHNPAQERERGQRWTRATGKGTGDLIDSMPTIGHYVQNQVNIRVVVEQGRHLKAL